MIDDSNRQHQPEWVSLQQMLYIYLLLFFFCTSSGENRSTVFRQRISLHPAFFGICKLRLRWLVAYARCSSIPISLFAAACNLDFNW